MITISEDPIIIDTGTYKTKAGIANNEFPTSIIPCCLLKNGSKISNEAFSEATHFNNVNFPNNEKPPNFNDLTLIWEYVYSKALNIEGKHKPVFLADSPFSSKKSREDAIKMFFENFKVSKFSIMNESTLSLYSVGVTKGVVIDFGGFSTTISPVSNGFSLPHLGVKLDFGGVDLTLELKNQFFGDRNITCKEYEFLDKIKSEKCYVAQEFTTENGKCEKEDLKLPDGNIIKIKNEKITIPESLFTGKLGNIKFDPIHEIIHKVIESSDPLTKSLLYDNILLTGGGNGFKGLDSRILKELNKIVNGKKNVNLRRTIDGSLAVWKGANILSTLKSFDRMMIRKDEYEETGPGIVHRKCY